MAKLSYYNMYKTVFETEFIFNVNGNISWFYKLNNKDAGSDRLCRFYSETSEVKIQCEYHIIIKCKNIYTYRCTGSYINENTLNILITS